MPTEYESFADQLAQSDAEAPPPPPPPMPAPADPVASTPPPEKPAGATTMAAPVEKPDEKADGWQVDFYRLRAFNDAVVRARSYLDAVQAKVDRMQGTELTPQLGTSPVGTQLAKKFDDRLNSADGLRVMLTEAMKRMDEFVASAEKAARAYEEHEESSVVTFTAFSPAPPPVKRG